MTPTDQPRQAVPNPDAAASPSGPRRELIDADARHGAGRAGVWRRLVSGMFSTRLDKSAGRLGLIALVFVGLYGAIGGRLLYLGLCKE
jgi:cell division protein FtsI (penicillin-binding protein 3)